MDDILFYLVIINNGKYCYNVFDILQFLKKLNLIKNKRNDKAVIIMKIAFSRIEQGEEINLNAYDF